MQLRDCCWICWFYFADFDILGNDAGIDAGQKAGQDAGKQAGKKAGEEAGKAAGLQAAADALGLPLDEFMAMKRNN